MVIDDICNGEEEFGDTREFLTLLIKEFCDSRNNEHKQYDHEQNANDNHNDWVNHGTDDSGFKPQLAFEESGESFKNDVKAA